MWYLLEILNRKHKQLLKHSFTGNLILLKFNTMSIEDLDNRMFQLFEELKNRGVLKYKRAFCAACGLPEQNMSNIKNKVNHFTLIHVANICKFYNLNANWILDSTEKELFRRKNFN